MSERPAQLSQRKIFLFWLPLALTWLMMSVEGPLLAALIARLPNEVVNLAAYGVAYAFALVAEAPVIMLLSASTSLCRGAESYRRLRLFTFVLSFGVILLLVLLALEPVFELVGVRLLGLHPEVAAETRMALWFLLPWPGAIGLRRFYQGVLIADGRTRRVTLGTLMRVTVIALVGVMLTFSGLIPGAVAGATALSCGVTAEALATRFLARPSIATMLKRDDADSAPGLGEIWNFYLPLALTPFIGLAAQPLIVFFLGNAVASLESLAVLPVLYGLTFVFRALGLSYQEAAIALIGDKLEQRPATGCFARRLAVTVGIVLGLIALTPLAELWLEGVSGLSPQLAQFSRLPLILMIPMPLLTVWITWQRALLVKVRVTRPISIATAVEAVAIFLLLAATVTTLELPGITLVAATLVLSRLLAILYLAPYCRRVA